MGLRVWGRANKPTPEVYFNPYRLFKVCLSSALALIGCSFCRDWPKRFYSPQWNQEKGTRRVLERARRLSRSRPPRSSEPPPLPPGCPRAGARGRRSRRFVPPSIGTHGRRRNYCGGSSMCEHGACGGSSICMHGRRPPTQRVQRMPAAGQRARGSLSSQAGHSAALSAPRRTLGQRAYMPSQRAHTRHHTAYRCSRMSELGSLRTRGS